MPLATTLADKTEQLQSALYSRWLVFFGNDPQDWGLELKSKVAVTAGLHGRRYATAIAALMASDAQLLHDADNIIRIQNGHGEGGFASEEINDESKIGELIDGVIDDVIHAFGSSVVYKTLTSDWFKNLGSSKSDHACAN